MMQIMSAYALDMSTYGLDDTISDKAVAKMSSVGAPVESDSFDSDTRPSCLTKPSSCICRGVKL